MDDKSNLHPIIDLHCDMPHYLATVSGADPHNGSDIGCAIPYLRQGNVKLQIMAISSVEEHPDIAITEAQMAWIERLLTEYDGHFTLLNDTTAADQFLKSEGVTIISAVENASALCPPGEPLEKAFAMLEDITARTGKPLYISLTHHGENRFGGGNRTDIGLKEDGRSLLEYITGRKIAVDLSHTSDALAHDIIDCVDSQRLNIPVIASHSNFRTIYDHRRNLPDELARAIIDRGGLIGINFLRAFLHPENPDYLTRHVVHGLEKGGRSALALGADYFCTNSHPDPSRIPFYFEQHEHAGKYQAVLDSLLPEMDNSTVAAIAYGNAVRFIEGLK
ncbi:MAG: membrane dipeptidase [Candidatus Zixiibacteriota bacterium]|nr:MAG: membrane dipeptidase [candidate division Zixibacteria bacterium]